MAIIRLLDARRGLNRKCEELFRDERIAELIYRFLCDGIEECEDAEPERKKGKWIDTEGMYICSECGRPTEDRHDVPCEWNGKKGIALVLPYYCGFCGADMRGSDNDR